MNPSGLRELPPFEYDPGLIEEAVLRAIVACPAERAFRSARDALYQADEGLERDASFDALHSTWFRHLALDAPVRDAVRAHPTIARGVDRVLVARARSPKEEGADLLVPRRATSTDGSGRGRDAAGEAPASRPSVVIRLRPDTLLSPDATDALLASELLHVADMLDPSFGYEPYLPDGGAGDLPPNLAQERYRLLWSASVTGRLVRLGRLPREARERARHVICSAFPRVAANAPQIFEDLLDAPRPTHAWLVALVRGAEPAGAAARARAPSPQEN